MSLGHLYWRMSGVRVFFFLVGVACLAGSMAIVLSISRERARRTQCGKHANRLMTAQNAYATYQNARGSPSRYFSGLETPQGFRFDTRYPELQQSDASRVFAYMIRKNALDSAADLACPSDPFIAPLEFTGAEMNADDVDLPPEGKALEPGRWAPANSVATREDGRTWFSYSMQTASLNPHADLEPPWLAQGVPGLHAKIPMFSDRNPQCDVFGLSGSAAPVGNSWNHNGEGQSLAFPDGHSVFLTDAGKLELPLDPSKPNSATGFDHLYNDEPIAQGESRSGLKCIPAGTFGRTVFFNAWLTD